MSSVEIANSFNIEIKDPAIIFKLGNASEKDLEITIPISQNINHYVRNLFELNSTELSELDPLDERDVETHKEELSEKIRTTIAKHAPEIKREKTGAKSITADGSAFLMEWDEDHVSLMVFTAETPNLIAVNAYAVGSELLIMAGGTLVNPLTDDLTTNFGIYTENTMAAVNGIKRVIGDLDGIAQERRVVASKTTKPKTGSLDAGGGKGLSAVETGVKSRTRARRHRV